MGLRMQRRVSEGRCLTWDHLEPWPWTSQISELGEIHLSFGVTKSTVFCYITPSTVSHRGRRFLKVVKVLVHGLHKPLLLVLHSAMVAWS